MELNRCPKCEKPYLANEEFCPHCPRSPLVTKDDSYGALGCVLLTVVGLIAMVIFWIVFIGSFFFR